MTSTADIKPLFVALSSLQGRPMQNAFEELADLTGAVQLTPGNHPTAGFEEVTSRSALTRKHHGFAFGSRRRDVWAADATCIVDADSFHPPVDGSPAATAIRHLGVAAWLETVMDRGNAGTPARLLETMYPGYVLGSGEELEVAMQLGVHLAVDVSHVFIQLTQGTMTDATWRRLSAYERIGEVHVSANQGRHDTHMPMTRGTFGLDWARERFAAGTPTVVECYMHRLSPQARRDQVGLMQ